MKKISLYYNATDATSQVYIDLDNALEMIKQGNAPYINLQNHTSYLRQLRAIDEKRYKEEKRKLPMIAYGGTFRYRSNNPADLIDYSDILILDFDFQNPDATLISQLINYLINSADNLHIYSVWQSPGHGVKAAMIHDNIDPMYHLELFRQVEERYNQIGLTIDPNCKDVSRTCYLSYDPYVWRNPNSVTPYHFVHDPTFQIPSRSTIPVKQSYTGNHKFQHTPYEICMNHGFQMTYSDKTLMNRLHKDFDRQNPNYYKDGYRHNEIKKRATLFSNDGILYENALASLKGKFGPRSRAGMNEADIESMVNSCYTLARADFGKQRYAYLNYGRNNVSKK